MAEKAPIERKVTASTAAAVAASVVVAVLNAVVADSSLLGPLPAWAQALIVAVAPGLVTFLGGYQARHTPRAGDLVLDGTLGRYRVVDDGRGGGGRA